MSNIGRIVTKRDMSEMSMKHLGHGPIRWLLLMPSNMNLTILETMMTSTQDRQLCARREII